eukprot:jgi/Galph1/2971/GphlegSOOS_G1646.1
MNVFIGPAKLCQALGINKEFNQRDLCVDSTLYLTADSFVVAKDDIITTPRVGVEYAGKKWSQIPLRFYLKSFSEFVSKPPGKNAKK